MSKGCEVRRRTPIEGDRREGKGNWTRPACGQSPRYYRDGPGESVQSSWNVYKTTDEGSRTSYINFSLLIFSFVHFLNRGEINTWFGRRRIGLGGQV